MTRIGGGSNPMNDPTWIEKKLLNNEELTPEENKTLGEQTQELTKTVNTLNQFVGKGDMKAARERVDGLKQQFESLSPDMKDYMYQSLTNKSGLAEKFEYKLSTASREKLLKILNPDHKESQNLRKVDSQKVNLEKAHEKTFEGKLQQASLQKVFDEVSTGNETKSQLFDDPGFTPKAGTDKGLGDPGFTPKVAGDDKGLGDPGFSPKVVGSDKGLGDPGFTPKLKPDNATSPQLPTDDPGFTPKVVGSDKGLGDPGFTPKVKPDNTRPQLPNDDPGFTPKVGKG